MFLFTDGDEHFFQICGSDPVFCYAELSLIKVNFFEQLLEVDAKVFWQCVNSFT